MLPNPFPTSPLGRKVKYLHLSMKSLDIAYIWLYGCLGKESRCTDLRIGSFGFQDEVMVGLHGRDLVFKRYELHGNPKRDLQRLQSF